MKPTSVRSEMSDNLVLRQTNSRRAANFDAIARPYRWLEYLTFGRLLERVRFAHISRVTDRKRALILGDGDGRFLARLAFQNQGLYFEAVDSSSRMLALLQSRICEVGARDRVILTQADVNDEGFHPHGSEFDLVVTHFFFDCFTDREVETIVDRIIPRLANESTWIVSEFDVPSVGPNIRANSCQTPLHVLWSTNWPCCSFPARLSANTSKPRFSSGKAIDKPTRSPR